MKQSNKIRTTAIEPAGGILRPLLHWLLLASFFAGTAQLGACDTSSTDGGIDPGIVEIPVAFIKRPIPLDDMGVAVHTDVREPLLFTGGGDVYLRSSSTIDATITNLTSSVTGGVGDVKGLNASFDGTRLIFSLRLADPNPNDDIVPSWNIYEYDLTSATLRRVIPSLSTAERGNDLHPFYLPDGRIVFTSDRQAGAREMLLSEFKPSFAALDESENTKALVLHVMNSDGTNIRQISFNQSHDLYPQVLTHYDPGKIVFSRWDNAEDSGEFDLFTINPDGSDLEILYGSRSHDTGFGGANVQFTHIRETEDGDLMVIAKPFTDTFDGGDIVVIDVARYIDNDKAIWPLSSPGPAQQSVSVANVNNAAGAISTNGRYGTAFPLWDGSNRILVSKSTCQLDVNGTIRPCVDPYLTDPAAVEASPNFSIWLYDAGLDTEKPIILAEPNRVITEAIALETRPRAPVIFDKSLTGTLDPILEAELLGVVNIKSVYDTGDTTFDGCFFGFCTGAAGINSVQDFADPANATALQRPARFVRFTRPVAIPDPDDPELMDPPDLDNAAFGLSRDRGMREIVGYAPVEPDGSVKIKVPANVPLAVEVLDAEGRRIGPRHRNWFQVQPGDEITCVGCHDTANPEVHVRADGEAPSINGGAPAGTLANTLVPGQVAPYPYPATVGETLAEIRYSSGGLADPPNPPANLRLSTDLVYDDYWTDPGVRAADASYAYTYSMLDPTILRPTNTACSPVWLSNCRITINYPDQIHALFQLPRGPDNFTVEAPANPVANDPTNTPLVTTAVADGIGDWTCIACHTTMNGTRLPYGQLDLTTDPNQDPNNRFRSYNEMFLDKQGRFFDGVNLVPFQIDDGTGNLIDDPAANVAPSMRPAGARASYFMEKMTGTELDAGRAILSSFDHSVMMSPHELKLIGEWLDLGGQNFNNPFDPDAPQD